jgi:hypothetical protein
MQLLLHFSRIKGLAGWEGSNGRDPFTRMIMGSRKYSPICTLHFTKQGEVIGSEELAFNEKNLGMWYRSSSPLQRMLC